MKLVRQKFALPFASFQRIPSALAGLCLICGWWASPALGQVAMKTHVYKTVAGLPIKADVYASEGQQARPVVVWIHGGALINGHREGIDRRLKEAFLEQGYVLVSIDYRLAPETKLPEIIADIEDAFRWVRQQGPELFHADPQRIAVAGGSAGGYLTLTAGFRVQPPPKALVSLWGYGDLVGAWYSEPSPHARHQQIKMSREDAFRQVAGPPMSDSRDRKGDGGAFYQHCRQHGLWPHAVSGWDPKREADKFAPFMPVRNVTPHYPPTLMIHGDRDTDVPYEQSQMMAAELQRQDVVHRLIRVQGGEHGLADADPDEIAQAYREAVAFVRQRLE
jgi:acetyl esterase/lipase